MSVRRRHEMPFGTEIVPGGAVRFRLWAPSAKQVDLVLVEPDKTRQLAMTGSDGWFEVTTKVAGPGQHYRYRIDGGLEVPDPVSRFNSEDVLGPSVVVDPLAFEWNDENWKARPWHESVVYELHIGTFSPEGTFLGAISKLDHLAQLGITAIELMPVADFPGKRGWGYDGVLEFAPDSAYGTPEDLKKLICAAHERGLAVMLDVVYNHFGPEGNYLSGYSPQFFTEKHHTPWGAAINFDAENNRTVRDFFIHNALYWLEEYHFDGLRFDAVHAIMDDSELHVLHEIAATVRKRLCGGQRNVYLILENGSNTARYLGPPGGDNTFDAQWNDDEHHCFHVILTGETDGYYSDYAENPHGMLCKCLAQGFGYQGEISQHEGGKPRGEPSGHLPPSAFVNFLQDHDQIGNRAFGERLAHLVKNEDALRAATAVLLLAPQIPMLFMGEEWAAPQPFNYFCDFGADLAQKVREGRRKEFAKFARFSEEATLHALPDATAVETFQSAKLDWSVVDQGKHAEWLEYYRRLLAIRQRDIAPRLGGVLSGTCLKLEDNGAFAVDWGFDDGCVLHLLANLTSHTVPIVGRAAGRVVFSTHPNIRAATTKNELRPWSVMWLLERPSE